MASRSAGAASAIVVSDQSAPSGRASCTRAVVVVEREQRVAVGVDRHVEALTAHAARHLGRDPRVAFAGPRPSRRRRRLSTHADGRARRRHADPAWAGAVGIRRTAAIVATTSVRPLVARPRRDPHLLASARSPCRPPTGCRRRRPRPTGGRSGRPCAARSRSRRPLDRRTRRRRRVGDAVLARSTRRAWRRRRRSRCRCRSCSRRSRPRATARTPGRRGCRRRSASRAPGRRRPGSTRRRPRGSRRPIAAPSFGFVVVGRDVRRRPADARRGSRLRRAWPGRSK